MLLREIILLKLGYKINSRVDERGEKQRAYARYNEDLECRAKFCGNERVAGGFCGFEFAGEHPLLPTQRHGESRRNSSTRSPAMIPEY